MADPVEWAKAESARLRSYQSDRVSPGSIAQALEFLRRHAPNSAFVEQADVAKKYVISSAARLMADVLDAWVAFVEAGMANQIPFEARARIEATTDLLEQADALLDDSKVHVAAPIVLIGAALEEFLRSLMAANSVSLPPNQKPAIGSYAEALRKATVLTRQDVKEITAWAGLRNDAAHGLFDDLTVPAARVMLMGVNVFMRGRSPAAPSP